MIKKYIINILFSLDQLVNTLLGGDPDEVLSSRIGKHYKGTQAHRFIDWLFSWQNKPGGHCVDAIEPDEGGNSVIK